MTLTQCRFEARANGYEQVIVVDADEFLYCPSVADSYARQSEYMHAAVGKFRDKYQIDQLAFAQYAPQNLTLSPKQCLYDKIINNEY